MPELKISPDVAKTVVSSGTVTKTKSVQTFTPVQDQPEEKKLPEIRLARAISDWTRDSNGIWKTTAYFIVDDKIDRSTTIEVFAPLVATTPTDDPNNKRFYVIKRNDRWESMGSQHREIKYGPGTAISITTPPTGPFDHVFNNAGIVDAIIRGDTYRDRGTMYFSPAYFYWNSNTLDIVGKRELCLRVKTVRVVTDVKLTEGNLELTTEDVTVLY